MRWRPSTVTTAAVTAAVALGGNLATSTVQIDAAWWPPAVWTLAGLLIAASILIEVTHRRGAAAPLSATGLDGIADQLAQAVREQWLREERQRKIGDPVALPVRWRPADEQTVDHWANIRRSPVGSSADPLAITGHIGQIADVYRQIPSGRLVILGRAGAGKTVLAARLVLDLLAVRTSGGRVPVVVSVGSWNPAGDTFADWLAAQLVRDHPGLAESPAGSPSAAALLAADRILPILDGFDEINPGLHQAALQQLNTACDLPMVLTSRPEQYTTAVRGVDVLTAAVGIELDDLTLADVADYLPRTTRRRDDDTRTGLWDPVLEHLHAHPHEPSAAALTAVLLNPLLVYLARTIYSDLPGRSPRELLDTRRFPGTTALEEHLLGGYIPAVYQHPAPTGRRWRPDQAQRSLAHLARHLDRLGTRDLAWWQLRDTVPRTARALLGGLTFALLLGLPLGLAMGLVAGPHVGLVAGLNAAIPAGLLGGLAAGLYRTGPEPARTRLRIRGRGRQLLLNLAVGLAFALVGGLAFGLAGGVAFGLIGGFADGIRDGLRPAAPPVARPRTQVRTRGRRLIGNLAAGLAAGLVTGLLVGLPAGSTIDLDRRSAGLALVLVVGLAAGLAAGFAGGLATGMVSGVLAGLVLIRHRRRPWAVRAHPRLRGRGRSVLLFGLAAVLGSGLVAGLMLGREVGLQSGPVFGLVFGLFFGIMLGIALGFAGGLVAGLRRSRPWAAHGHPQARGRERRLVVNLTVGLVVGLTFGLSVGLVGGLDAGLASGWLGGLVMVGLAVGVVAGLALTLEAPIDMSAAPGVSDSLTTDRTNTLRKVAVVTVAVAVAAPALIGLDDGLESALAVGLFFGPVLGLAFGLAGAWGQWLVITRVWLPLTGRLPWSSRAFLEDAHRRGVLRQVGAVYQFRHARLQDHLTALHPGQDRPAPDQDRYPAAAHPAR